MYYLEVITIHRQGNGHYIDNLVYESFLGKQTKSYIMFQGRRRLLHRVTETDDDMDIGAKIRAINDGFYFTDNGAIHIVRHADCYVNLTM
jgi:hypothetical protein